MEEKEAYLAKARESLVCAESEFTARRYNTAARNIYYALFQAAVAALLQENVRPKGDWGHDFVQAQFAGLLVYRRKAYPAEFRTTLVDAHSVRIKADYTAEMLGRRDVQPLLEQAVALLGLVERRIG